MADIILSKLDYDIKSKDILNYAISKTNDYDRIVVDTNINIGITFLKSNLEIHILDGITIMASSNINDFLLDKNKEFNLVTRPTWEDCSYNGAPISFLFYANKIENFKFSGNGVIDGNEEIFYGRVTKDHIEGKFYPRVPLIYLCDSKNINISDITIRRSAFWTIHLIGVRHAVIDNIKILNSKIFANCDGIDIDSSNDVVVKNSNIVAADDCIVLKTTNFGRQFGPCHNIRAFNNVLESTSAAIKIGSETEADFYDIKFRDTKIINSNRGISFQLRDSGCIYDVSFKDIYIDTRHYSPLEWWGKAEPIFISANKRYKNSVVGNIKDIKFNNIFIDSENSIFLYGDISNIDFSNITFKMRKKTDYDLLVHDIRPSEEYNGPIKMPLSLIYIDGAKDINFNNFIYHIEDDIKDYIDNNFIINGENIKINS